MADMNVQRMKLRAKKLGILICDSRMAANRTIDDCAAYLGVPSDHFLGYEKGSVSPSLPVLEALAVYLDVPINHFWENTILSSSHPEKIHEKEKNRRELRDRIIATHLRKERKSADISLRQIAKEVSLPADLIKQYEMAEIPIPIPELELIASVLHIPRETFIDDIGQVKEWRQTKDQQIKFMNLDPDTRTFITDPINKPFLDMAMQLSELPQNQFDEISRKFPKPEGTQI